MVINTVAETKVKELEEVDIIEASVKMPKPDKVVIWHRKRGVTDMKTHREGQNIELTLSLNFNPTTLKYTITIN